MKVLPFREQMKEGRNKKSGGKMKAVKLINENWLFTKEGVEEMVNVPHCWNAIDGQNMPNYYRGECSYKKTLEGLSGITIVRFEGANSVAKVFANGNLIQTHRGGYSAFSADLTAYVVDGKCDLEIKVDNSDFEDVYPSTADFTFYGGMYRNVTLFTGIEKGYFDVVNYGGSGIKATPRLDDGKWSLTLSSATYGAGDKVVYSVVDMEGKEILSLEAKPYQAVVSILENPTLWDTKNPYLYAVKASLYVGDELIDESSTRFGVREIIFDSEKGCILNGKRVKLKGVSRHQDRENLGNALTYEHIKEDVELIKEVGSNSIRLAHYQQNQIIYDLCDEYGILVWAEIPVISRWAQKKLDNAKSQLVELINQNYNHPSIFCWGVQNEITIGAGGGASKKCVKGVRELNDIAKSMDDTRPTTCAQVMMASSTDPLNYVTDILGFNIYYGWYMQRYIDIDKWLDDFHAKNPNLKLCLSEYGAEAVLRYYSSNPAQGDYGEQYQAILHDHYANAIMTRDWMWGGYVWNMFDFGSAIRNEGGVIGKNNKGLVTFDRKTRKDSFYAYKAHWSDEKFVHVGGERYAERAIGKSRVDVFSNLDEVELIVNGVSYGTKSGKLTTFEVDIVAGENEIVAKAGEYVHAIKVQGVEEEPASYKCNQSGNLVRNWFAADDATTSSECLSINDKVGVVLQSEDVKAMLGSKIPAWLAKVASPFKVKTLLKLARIAPEMQGIVNNFLQTIKK